MKIKNKLQKIDREEHQRISSILQLGFGGVRNHNSITIDHFQKELRNHKQFLTKEGKKILEDRKKDF